MEKINEEILKIWEENTSLVEKYPLLYPHLEKNRILFVGINPSFSEVNIPKISKIKLQDFDYPGKNPEEVIPVLIKFEEDARKDYIYFKKFEDIDILIEDAFINDRWEEFKKIFETHGFKLVDEREHEFEIEGKKVGFASKNILIRDKIINDYRELVQYKNEVAFTLKPEDFLKAYRFSIKDGYRINTRGKKDDSIIEKLEIYIKR